MRNRKIIKESIRFPIRKYKHFLIVTILFLILELLQYYLLQNTYTYTSIIIFGTVLVILPLLILGINLQIIFHIIGENRGLPKISIRKSVNDAAKDMVLESYYLGLTIIISTIFSIPTGIYHNMYDIYTSITEKMVELEGVNIILVAGSIPDMLLSNYINSVRISTIIFIITFIILFSICTLSKIDLEINQNYKQTFNIKYMMKIIKKIGIIKYLGFVFLLIIVYMIISSIAYRLNYTPIIGYTLSAIMESFILFFSLKSFALLYPK